MSRDSSLVTFDVHGQWYAFPVEAVVEVATGATLTRVPGAGDGLAGVTSWRGRTIPVFRLEGDLKPVDAAPDQECRVLILRDPGPFALRIDRPGDILREWTPVVVEGRRGAAADAFTRDGDRTIRILGPNEVVAAAGGAAGERAL